MPQIGFTHKTEPIYHRFNALRRAYEDANGGGRVYNPDFLTVLMDAWERYHEPTTAPSELQPVRIKDSNNRYMNNATVAASNFFLTHDRSEAMIFDRYEHAKAFLRKYGRDVEDWILEPVNETK